MNLKNMAFGIVLSMLATNLFAYTIVEDIATHAGGYDIPIKIYLPDNASKKHPVQFHVHGGGWNGGSATEVPGASVKNDADLLCDRLGIIYVGLAYRCKGNNGTFELAIEDLEASIQWFMNRAETYNADTTRLAFSGGSAGTTLSSVLAQRYPNCKAYIGTEGMYNLVDPDGSNFPDADSRADFGLTDHDKALAASAYYNLASPPPAALLFHGKDDYLCDPIQSVQYADTIIKAGGKAKVILYERINHTCMSITYPDVFRNTVFEVAKFLIDEFELTGVDTINIKAEIDKKPALYDPYNPVPVNEILGTWSSKEGNIIFKKNGICEIRDDDDKAYFPGYYIINGPKISVFYNDGRAEKEFFYRKDNVICEFILENTRQKSRVWKCEKIADLPDEPDEPGEPEEGWLDKCDQTTDWKSGNALSLNTTNYKEGTASLQSSGDKKNDFMKAFNPAKDFSNIIESTASVEFWYYVSDVSLLLSTNNGVEIGSAGTYNKDEYNWTIDATTMVNGWNFISLPFRNAVTSGNPDFSGINWFRMFVDKTGAVTSYIDDIRIVGESKSTTNAAIVSGSLSESSRQIKLYPNPLSKGELVIDFSNLKDVNNVSVQISNLSGQTRYSTTVQNQNKIAINTNGLLKPSVYIVSVQSANVILSSKLIVQ